MGLPRGRVRSMGAASRPYSINAAVWLAFVAVNGVCMHCRQDLFLKIQETRHAAVCVSFGSLMVHRQQWDTSWGAKKFNFLIRDIVTTPLGRARRWNPVDSRPGGLPGVA